ncbi:nucleolar complex-associated protein-domain-containing protein [Terfezia claveryi]|nr:nucleolar complex-associated protein-domain-containing protein [Terfezia claveryi]
MGRKSSKKVKGLPASVGKFDINAGLQANAFTQVKTKSRSEGKRLLPVWTRNNDAESETDDEGQGGYESMPRSFEKSQKRKERLPIKTQEGVIRNVEADLEEEEEAGKEEESRESEGEDEMERGGGDDDDANSEEEDKEDGESRKPLPTKAQQRQQILEAKEELAQIGLSLNEDPEENSHFFRRLRELSYSHLPTIKKLSLATQLSVYKSVIPGYRIRPLTAEEQTAKVTKEVRKLRTYEQALVHSYQQYVEHLSLLSRGGVPKSSNSKPPSRPQTKLDLDLAHLAVTCASSLLLSVPHFNFRTDLLKILIDRLSKRTIDQTHIKARQTIEELFRTDEDGTASLDAVQLLVKMFKARRYNIHESVLNTFLFLRLLTELDVKASQDRVDKPTPDSSSDPNANSKKRKRGDDPKKAFKTKRQKKLEREQSTVLAELKEADAIVSSEEREKMQSETLKLVFSAYFQVLKDRPEGNNLMAATLEGLAKFSHLINIDFFTTLLAALKELIQDAAALASPYFPSMSSQNFSANSQSQTTRESLLCITTAFALLSGQQSTLTSNPSTSSAPVVPLDLTFFTSTSSPSSARSRSTPTSMNLSTQTSLLIRSLTSVLTPPHPPRPPPSRAAAFTKRLLTFSLLAPEKSSIASLGIIAETARKNRGPTGSAVKNVFRLGEKVGDGGYRCYLPEEAEDEGGEGEGLKELDEEWLLGVEERVNPLAGSAWEVALLGRHYSPKVRGAVEEVVRGVGGGGGGGTGGEKEKSGGGGGGGGGEGGDKRNGKGKWKRKW